MKQITVAEAYELADWAVRTVCPAFLEYDDGKRKAFPEFSKPLRNVRPITDRFSADSASSLLQKDILPKVAEYRDGMLTVPLRSAYWLCLSAMCIERGIMLPTDYGSEGIRDVLDYMKVPVKV